MDGCRELRTSSLTRKAPTGRGPAQSRQKEGIWERKHSSQRFRIGDEEGDKEGDRNVPPPVSETGDHFRWVAGRDA